MYSEKNLKLYAARSICLARSSRRTKPVAAHSRRASVSALSKIICRQASKHSILFSMEKLAQLPLSKAALAALTAFSTDCSSSSINVEICSPVAG